MVDEFLDGVTTYTDILRMHLMTLYLFALDRFEGSSTNVKSQFLTVYASSIDGSENLRSEMQTSCRSRNTTLDL